MKAFLSLFQAYVSYIYVYIFWSLMNPMEVLFFEIFNTHLFDNLTNLAFLSEVIIVLEIKA